jgi:hypothetical protein
VLAAASLQATDPLAVADLSASETKKITAKDLVQAAMAMVAPGSLPSAAIKFPLPSNTVDAAAIQALAITTGKIALDAITSAQIAPNAVTASELADLSVDTAALANLAVTGDKIANDTITAVQIAPNAIGSSELANGAVGTPALLDGAVTQAKLATDSVGAVQIQTNAITAAELADGAVDTAALANLAVTGDKIAANTITAVQIAPAAITDVELAANSVSTAKVQDNAITAAKIADNSIGALQIAPNSITASELADGSVDTLAVHDAAITNAKLAGGITGDKIVSITGAQITTDSITATQLAPNAVTAVELADNAVDTAALLDKAVTTSKIADDSVGALQIAPHAITASELANGSVDTLAIINSAVTDAKLATGIDGAKFTDDTVTAAKIPAASLDRGLNKTSGAIGHSNAITAGTRSGITYDAQGHVTGTAPLVPSDLPLGTATDVGALSVPTTSGLAVSGTGALGHSNVVTAGASSGISYDAHGHITAVTPLVGSDLPSATSTTLGAVSIPGPALSVNGTGQLSHGISGVAPGTYTKLTVDERGHATVGALITAADVPSLDASKITSGTLDPSRIAAKSITNQMLADYSIAYIQEATPSVSGQHAGTLWLQESTGQLRMFNSNSWFPVGFGRLSAENLRYCGTFNAATGQITGVTQFGTTEGFKIGDPLPAATDAKSGVYFVCATPGNGTPVTAGVTYDNGDWVLCNGVTAGWVRVDTLSGGGGGGSSASHLDDLLDVTLTAASAGDQLVFGAGGQWINKAPATSSATAAGLVQLATQAEVDAGTDALKAVTPKTLQDAVLSCGTF